MTSGTVTSCRTSSSLMYRIFMVNSKIDPGAQYDNPVAYCRGDAAEVRRVDVGVGRSELRLVQNVHPFTPSVPFVANSLLLLVVPLISFPFLIWSPLPRLHSNPP